MAATSICAFVRNLVLGIGGVRALDELGYTPSVYHMNEGHSAFLAIDRVRRRMQNEGLSFSEASMLVKQTTVFTTHTPVPAGIDRFPRELVERYLRPYYSMLGISANDFFALGSQNGAYGATEFNMAYLAMNFSSYINGVSKLHAEVSRKMWQGSWVGVPLNEVPIRLDNQWHSCALLDFSGNLRACTAATLALIGWSNLPITAAGQTSMIYLIASFGGRMNCVVRR